MTLTLKTLKSCTLPWGLHHYHTEDNYTFKCCACSLSFSYIITDNAHNVLIDFMSTVIIPKDTLSILIKMVSNLRNGITTPIKEENTAFKSRIGRYPYHQKLMEHVGYELSNGVFEYTLPRERSLFEGFLACLQLLNGEGIWSNALPYLNSNLSSPDCTRIFFN
jgi:hypothetical protein